MNYLKRKREQWNNASPMIKLLIVPFLLPLIPLSLIFAFLFMVVTFFWIILAVIVLPLKMLGFDVHPFDIDELPFFDWI